MKDTNTTYDVITKKLSSKGRQWLLFFIMIIPIMVICLSSWFVYICVEEDKENFNRSIIQYQISRSDVLTGTISETYKRAELQTEHIKTHIIEQLDQEYAGNKDLMREDYLSRDTSRPFYQILHRNIQSKYLNLDNGDNRVFIANREGILIDDSLVHYQNSFKTWEDYMSAYTYKELLENSVSKLQYHTNGIVLWIDDRDDVESVSIRDFNMPIEEFIHSQVVSSNSLDELRSYSVVTASYIFDHEDIFGVPDVIAGQNTNNDKLYIIQVFNIGDMIDTSYNLNNTLTKYQYMIESTKEIGEDVIMFKTVALIILITLEILTFFGIWYLVEVYFVFNPIEPSKHNTSTD